MTRFRPARWVALVGLLAVLEACAPKVVPPAAIGAPHYPDFVFPASPVQSRASADAASVETGWRDLQRNELSMAGSAFGLVLARAPRFHPARAGLGYVALARRRHAEALTAFDEALAVDAAFVPALVGRGLALLALARDDDAVAALEAAVAADPSLVEVQRRVEILRFRRVERLIEAARAARDRGRLDEAHTAYQRAIQASPESDFLHRELGAVERARGERESALARFREAARLDASDVVAWLAVGELLEAAGDDAGAAGAYRSVQALGPSPQVSERLAAIAERAREAALPIAFKQVPAKAAATRADLAALIGIRAPALLSGAPTVQEVVTDTSGHWAHAWIADVVRAGVIDPFPNHTFQPDAPLRRLDLATVAGRLMRLWAQSRPDVRAALAATPPIADVGARSQGYTAAAASVAAGVLGLRPGDRFEPNGGVSGAEAQHAVERLRAWLLDRQAP